MPSRDLELGSLVKQEGSFSESIDEFHVLLSSQIGLISVGNRESERGGKPACDI
jgi:hypothetical protein